MGGRVVLVSVVAVAACITPKPPPAGPARYTTPEISPMPPIELTGAVSLASANVSNLFLPGYTTPVEDGAVGVTFGGQVGLRFGERGSAGIHASIGTLVGEYELLTRGVVYDTVSFGLVPIDVGAYLHARPSTNVWGGLLVGPHVVGRRFDGDTSWTIGAGSASSSARTSRTSRITGSRCSPARRRATGPRSATARSRSASHTATEAATPRVHRTTRIVRRPSASVAP